MRKNGKTASERVNGYDPIKEKAKYRMDAAGIALQYRIERAAGMRLSSGKPSLKQLSLRHKQMIYLFAQGMAAVDIADLLDMDFQVVYRAINDPLAQQWFASYSDHIDQELENLMTLSVGAVRDALQPGVAMDVRLKAVDRVAKLTGRYTPKTRDAGLGETAEDVIARALALAEKGIDAAISSRPERAKLIDLTPEN